jgi:hypothetical protein
MMPTHASAQEEAVLDILQKTGPCCLDDLVMHLPHLSWGEVFVAVGRMSRDGRLLLRRQLLIRRLGHSSYQITLPSQLASPHPLTISPGGGAPATPLAARF